MLLNDSSVNVALVNGDSDLSGQGILSVVLSGCAAVSSAISLVAANVSTSKGGESTSSTLATSIGAIVSKALSNHTGSISVAVTNGASVVASTQSYWIEVWAKFKYILVRHFGIGRSIEAHQTNSQIANHSPHSSIESHANTGSIDSHGKGQSLNRH